MLCAMLETIVEGNWSVGTVAATLLIGTVAGFMNVTAGGGSLLTVPLLVLLGLPSPVANGTNRVALIVQNVVAVSTFRRGGVRGFRRVAPLIGLAIPGAVLGAWFGVVVSDEVFRRVLGVVLIGVTAVIFIRPPAHENPVDGDAPLRPLTYVAFALLGLYAGFIQAGIGFLLVFALAGLERMPLVQAHAFKVTTVLVLQAIALPVFALGGKVEWIPGLVLACGLSLGGFIGARTALGSSERFLKILLAVCAVGLAIRMFVG